MRRGIAVVLLVFSLGLLPGVPPPEEPNVALMELAETSLGNESAVAPSKARIEARYRAFMDEQWRNWLQNALLLTFSLVAVALALFVRGRLGPGVILALCAVMLVIYVPPLIRLSEHGFLKFATIVVNSSAQREMLDRVSLLWHILIAPFAYACLAIASIILLIKRRVPEAAA